MFGSVYCKKNYLYNMNNYKLCFLLYIATPFITGYNVNSVNIQCCYESTSVKIETIIIVLL